MTGLLVVLGTLLLGLLAGVLLRAREGRIRPAADDVRDAALPDPVSRSLAAAPEITLLQISTQFCAPCRHARARLSALAEGTDGLSHVEFDVTDRVDVAQALGVRRTPTTIAFAPDGAELLRVSGVPTTESLLEELRPHLV